MLRAAVFTINNPGDHVPEYNETTMNYIGWARQRGLKKKTPHLQGLVVFKKKMRKRTIEIILMDSEERRCYVAPMRGTTEQARNYFVEDPKGTNESDPEEYGSIPEDVEPEKCNIQDQIHMCKEDIENGLISSERELFTEWTYLMTKSGVKDVLLKLLSYKTEYEKYPIGVDFKHFQPLCTYMAKYLRTPYEYRKFLWICDPKGMGGKTLSLKYVYNSMVDGKLADRKPFYFQVAKANDLAHMIPVEANVFLIDIARAAPIPYKIIECLRDGVLTSGKYMGTVKKLSEPRWIIVCSNVLPDPTRITTGDFTLINWPVSPNDNRDPEINEPYLAPCFLPRQKPQSHESDSSSSPKTKTTTMTTKTTTMGLGEGRREAEESKEPSSP